MKTLEEVLDEIIGVDNDHPRYLFRFSKYVYQLPLLRAYVVSISGETFVTNYEPFLENLKLYVDRGSIHSKVLKEGINALYSRRPGV